MKLVVLDLETSGLSTKPSPLPLGQRPHTPGADPDCILEVGLVVLDADTLQQITRGSWLVFPPNVENTVAFTRWSTELRERNPFVHDMHEKSGLLKEMGERMGGPAVTVFQVKKVEQVILSILRGLTTKTEALSPANSDLLFTGNSIANLDIPMLRLWMPELHYSLQYRILDVSVLRTFYVDIARTTLPAGVAEAIKSGGGGHRALNDAEWCAKSLRQLVSYARNAAAAGDATAVAAE